MVIDLLISGIPLQWRINSVFQGSFDRIDSSGVYDPDNLQLLTWCENRMKNAFSDRVAREFYNKWREHQRMLRGKCGVHPIIMQWSRDLHGYEKQERCRMEVEMANAPTPASGLAQFAYQPRERKARYGPE